jgi:hypothetical protein
VQAEGSLADIDRADQDLALAVTKAFYGLLWAERYREQVLETQQQKKLHAEMARTRFRNGVATEVDVLRSEVAVANTAPDLARAENDVRQARALLNYYLVRPIDFPTRPLAEFEEKPWTEGDLEALLSEALRPAGASILTPGMTRCPLFRSHGHDLAPTTASQQPVFPQGNARDRFSLPALSSSRVAPGCPSNS